VRNLPTRSYFLIKKILFTVLFFISALSVGAPQQPVKTEGLPLGIPAIEAIKTKIAELEPAVGQEGSDSKELENYRQTLVLLQTAEKEQEQAQLYKQTVNNAEQQLSRLRDSLAKATAEHTTPELPAALTVEELIRRHNQAQSDRQLAQSALRELLDRQAAERVRPEQSGVELADAKRELEALEIRLLTDTPNDIPTHQKKLMLATQAMLKSKVHRLEMERLSHTHRMDQLALKIKLAQVRLKQLDDLVQLLQERISALQAKEAEQAQQDAQKAQQKAAGKHPLIQQYADENAELSRKLSQLASQAEKTILALDKTISLKKSIRQNQERVQQQIIIGGLDDRPGRLLQKQRNALPKLAEISRDVDIRRAAIATSRLESFQVEDLQRQLQMELSQDLIDSHRPADLSEEEWRKIRPELKQLLQNRLILLDKIKAAYGRYEKALADLNAEQLQLYDRVEQYAALLDRHLLWIPSTTRIGAETFSHALRALGWFFSAQNWQNAREGVITGIERHPYQLAVLLVVMGLLLYGRHRMYRTLEQITPAVGNVTHDTFMHTVKAFTITLLLALPWPLLIAALGWWLSEGSDQPFIGALSIGLLRLALFFFIIQILRYLFIKDGLAEVHFRWSPESGRLFRRHLHWLVPALIPLAFTVGILEWIDEEAYTNSLGRLAFIAGLLITALFFHRVLNPWSGIMASSDDSDQNGLNRLWYPAALFACLSLATLAFEGYYYSALSLERMLFMSLCAGVVIFLFYHLLVRWLLVAERRLALARARAKRQAVIEARVTKEVADAAGEGVPELTEFEEVNLATINEQTRRLLRVGSGLLFAALLYLVWEQLTPAMSWLNEVVLWQFETSSGQVAYISIWDALLALMVFILTLIAGRNLPGLLEIALLQPMNLDLGNRYAVSTISRYTIYAGGILLVLSLVGLQWADVQWLVAAMGVGLGFGLKEIFANFFSGIMILFERPIRIGDTVTIGDISGTVSRIRIRATTITDWDNKELVVPNKTFITDPLINWTLTDPITRIVIKVGIAYGSDTELAHRIMTEVVQNHPDVLDEPRPTVFFTGFGDSSLDFNIRVFVSDHLKRMPLTHDLHMALNKALAEANIEIPFPQRDLHLHWKNENIDIPGGSDNGIQPR